MLQFQPIPVQAIREFTPFLCGQNGRLCDFTPANLYVWKDYYYTGYVIRDDLLYFELRGEEGETYYSVPMGSGDRVGGLRLLYDHAASQGMPLRLSLICDDMLEDIRTAFGEVAFSYERDWCDYLYEATPMAAFTGAAYAKQRNHVRRFEREYPAYRVERLRADHVEALNAFLDSFALLRGKDSELAAEEIERTRRALSRMEAIDLLGVVLWVEDRLVGFSAGTRVCDTLYVNFEKADTAYHGVYQKLVQCFAQMFTDETVRFINREEDCGNEGLRKSKLAYHPTALLNKYASVIPTC